MKSTSQTNNNMSNFPSKQIAAICQCSTRERIKCSLLFHVEIFHRERLANERKEKQNTLEIQTLFQLSTYKLYFG